MKPIVPYIKESVKPKKSLELDLLAVGNASKSGDCILMRYGDLVSGKKKQTVIMIDGGFSDTATNTKRYLKKYYNCYYDGKYHIDYMFLSHPDSDHINGLVELLKDDEIALGYLIAALPWEEATPAWYKDGRITPNSLEKTLEEAFSKLQELTELAEGKNAKICGLQEQGVFDLEHEATLTILGPEKKFYNVCIANCEKTPEQAPQVVMMSESASGSDDAEEAYVPGKIKWDYSESTSPINESSMVFLFEYDGQKFLFCGDAGKEALKAAFDFADENDISLDDINVIKMPHHGSRHNVTPELMDRVKGKNTSCYISCVAGQEGHHPSKRLVNMLREKEFKVFKTSGNGLCRRYNTPLREGWNSLSTMKVYPKMEKLKNV